MADQTKHETAPDPQLPVMRFEIDPNQNLTSIVTALMLSASAVFHARFPGDEGAGQWEEAMQVLADRIREHCDHNAGIHLSAEARRDLNR